MANLYKRAGSCYWWMKSTGHDGRQVRWSTKFRVDSPQGTRKAQAAAHEQTAKELRRGGQASTGRWDKWVEKFLLLRYGGSPKTHLRYSIAWRNVRRFLEARRLRTPSEITYEHAMDFLEWRQVSHQGRGSFAVCQNTALTELRVLGVIMGEAVRRDYTERNPVLRIGIKRQPCRTKPAIPDEHLAAILQALETEPEWMRVCFTIGMHTGLRLNETRLWLPNVDTERRTIGLDAPKGGAARAFTIPYDAPELAALLVRLKAERGEAWAFDWPANLPSKVWFLFFRRVAAALGLPCYSFHCLRVSFITRGAKAGIPENMMQKLVNHAGTTVHRAYQRLSIEDARPYLSKLHPTVTESPDKA